MLVLSPGGGAMVLKSVGMFLERGRRGSAPQARALLHRVGAARKPAAEAVPQVGRTGVQKLSASDFIWSRKVTRIGREGVMAEESKRTGNKAQPKMMENLKKRTHFSRQEIEALVRIYRELLSSSSGAAGKVPSAAIAPGPGLQTNPNRVEQCGSEGARLLTDFVPGSSTCDNRSHCVRVQSTGISSCCLRHWCQGLDRIVFRELIHNAFDLVTEEVLVDRIFCAFDRNNDGVIKLEHWICGLSTFLRGTLEERAAFCFLVYDMNADGYIARDEMMNLLRNCLIKSPQDEDPEEGVRDLVELALRKMDVDKDGKISYEDFLEAVTAEPLLLEAFGQCLPTEAACQTFMSTLKA